MKFDRIKENLEIYIRGFGKNGEPSPMVRADAGRKVFEARIMIEEEFTRLQVERDAAVKERNIAVDALNNLLSKTKTQRAQ